jgi:predicted alpha/beta hydrolase family esterase
VQVLILHGWQGNAEGHWQTWLAERLRGDADVRYPALPNPDDPRPEAWEAALRGELDALGPEPVVVCHSLACALWLRAAANGARADRVLLVAPPAPDSEFPEIARFFPTGADAPSVAGSASEVRLVCADDDPYCPGGAAAIYGEPLGLPIDLVSGGGHLNTDAGYGPWPGVEAWVRGTARAVAPD